MLEIYKVTMKFPSEEKFGLNSQMRRCAISVPANIAEGFQKKGIKDKLNFYNIAQGSVEELKYYIILSKDLGYLKKDDDLTNQAKDVARMLQALINSINAKTKAEKKS